MLVVVGRKSSAVIASATFVMKFAIGSTCVGSRHGTPEGSRAAGITWPSEVPIYGRALSAGMPTWNSPLCKSFSTFDSLALLVDEKVGGTQISPRTFTSGSEADAIVDFTEHIPSDGPCPSTLTIAVSGTVSSRYSYIGLPTGEIS